VLNILDLDLKIKVYGFVEHSKYLIYNSGMSEFGPSEIVFDDERDTDAKAAGLLAEYHINREKEGLPKGEFILDKENKNADVSKLAVLPNDELAVQITYNPTEPIEINGEKIQFFREEPKGTEDTMMDSEERSVVVVYREKEDGEMERLPIEFHLQDPFYCGKIEGKHVFGGVEVYKEVDDKGKPVLGYKTVFYSFEEKIEEAKPFLSGPDRMKDIRFLQREDGKVDVFIRPQGKVGGPGRIGHFVVTSLEEADQIFRMIDTKSDDAYKFLEESLIDGLCGPEEWVGANELHCLPNGKIGVLCHIANSFPDPARRVNPEYLKNYYGAAFVYDPESREVVDPLKIVITAEDFDPVENKKADLNSIIFPGGMVKNNDGTATVYAGIGDTKSGRKQKADFWAEFR
jgi:hypothetical protein